MAEPMDQERFELHADGEQRERRELARRLRHVEKMLDTRATPWPRRLWFRIDGWPPWWIVAERRSWRPWHGRR